MWLKLSEGLFLFGNGGINRIQTVDQRDPNKKYIYITELYKDNLKVNTVKESIDIIEKMLYSNSISNDKDNNEKN